MEAILERCGSDTGAMWERYWSDVGAILGPLCVVEGNDQQSSNKSFSSRSSCNSEAFTSQNIPNHIHIFISKSLR